MKIKIEKEIAENIMKGKLQSLISDLKGKRGIKMFQTSRNLEIIALSKKFTYSFSRYLPRRNVSLCQALQALSSRTVNKTKFLFLVLIF